MAARRRRSAAAAAAAKEFRWGKAVRQKAKQHQPCSGDFPVGAGDAIDVGMREPHRMSNTGSEELVFVEVQHGESFAEDDIERLEDDFGR